MSAVELGRFNPIQADLLIGKLQSLGIAAFPLPYSDDGGYRQTGVLIDDSDLAEARAIVMGERQQ